MTTPYAAREAPPQPGAVLGGRFRLLEPLDSSGQGRVFRAHDDVLDRDVAVKQVDPEIGSPLGPRKRKKLRRLSHPGAAEIYDDVEVDGESYEIMELVPGETLAEALSRRGPLGPLEAIRVAVQIAEALTAIHRLGFVHCDVKPTNVMLSPAGSAKLIDFGIVRAAGRDDAERVLGSAPYIAPERLLGHQLDGRADVYSLGATLYEMLTGQPPHLGLDVEETLKLATSEDAVSPSSLNAEIPPDLAAATLRAVARDPDQRYADALEMAGELRAVGKRLLLSGGSATSEFARMERTASLPAERAPTIQATRGRVLVYAAILAVALLIGLLGVGLASGSQAETPARAADLVTAVTSPASVPSPTRAPVRSVDPTLNAAATPTVGAPESAAALGPVEPTSTAPAAPTPASVTTPTAVAGSFATSRQVLSVRQAPSGNQSRAKPTSEPKPEHPTKAAKPANKGNGPKAKPRAKPSKKAGASAKPAAPKGSSTGHGRR